MATLPVGLYLVGYTGSTVTLSSASWKNNVAVIYKENAGHTGWTSFLPSSGLNALTQLVAGNHYLFKITTSFDLPGADITHYQQGAGVPDGLVIMDNEQLVMI